MSLCENGCGKDAGVYKKTANGNRIGTPKRFCSFSCSGRFMGKLNTSKPAHNFGDRTTHCKCGLPRTPENTTKQGYCLVCARAAVARWQKRNPHAGRGGHYLTRYGITKEQFQEKLNAQEGKCKICRTILDYATMSTTPVVDHAHDETDKFRGVLCHHCNSGLGQFRDNAELLKEAIKYLKETQ